MTDKDFNKLNSKIKELEDSKDTIKRGTSDWCMWVAKYFLVHSMLRFNCDCTEVVECIIKNSTQIKIPDNVINIYNKAAYELMIELDL